MSCKWKRLRCSLSLVIQLSVLMLSRLPKIVSNKKKYKYSSQSIKALSLTMFWCLSSERAKQCYSIKSSIYYYGSLTVTMNTIGTLWYHNFVSEAMTRTISLLRFHGVDQKKMGTMELYDITTSFQFVWHLFGQTNNKIWWDLGTLFRPLLRPT